MNKKFLISCVCLLMLIIKPYVDINYSDETRQNNLISSYSYGYGATCENCTNNNHNTCTNTASQQNDRCGAIDCCCGYPLVKSHNSHYESYNNMYHNLVCECGYNHNAKE